MRPQEILESAEDVIDEGWREKIAAGAIGAGLALGGQQFYNHLNQPTQTQQQQQLSPKDILITAAKNDGMTGNELAQFLAQASHETLNFTRMKEIGTPEYFTKKYERHKKTAKILGNKVKGDGIRYRGRGYIQLTGRDNYQRAGQALGLPLDTQPDLAADPEVAAKIALWYWNTRVAPKVKNFDNTRAVTKTINPAGKHQQRRQQQFAKYQVAQNENAVPEVKKDSFQGIDMSMEREEDSSSGYKEIEFVCANPKFPDATDPVLQKKLLTGLQKIPGVIPLMQDWSDHSQGQSSLTAIYRDRAVRSKIMKLAQQLGVQIDLEQPVSDDYVDRAIRGEHEGQQVTEVKILSKVKGKGADPTRLPNRGQEIAANKIQQQLGRKVMDIDDTHSVYRDIFGGQITYNLLNKETGRSTLTVFGSRYPGNADSFIVSGLYASPDNDLPAAEFYRHLIRELDLTLISDRKQSPGGQRVWQRLEQLPGIEVYGYDTATGNVLNIGASDEEMYAVPSDASQGRDMGKVARDIRLVATAK